MKMLNYDKATEVCSINSRRVGNAFLLPKHRLRIMWLAALLAVIWYPLYYIYLYYAVIKVVPFFMDGIFGIIAAVSVVLLGGYFIINDAKRFRFFNAGIVITFFSMIIIMFALIVIYRFMGLSVQANNILLMTNLRILLQYVFLFLLGYYLRPERWSKIFFVLFIMVVVVVITNMDFNLLNIDMKGVRGYYLHLSSAFLVTGLLAWTVSEGIAKRLSVLILTLIMLFFNGSRADFGAFLLVLPMMLWFTVKKRWKYPVYGIIVLFIVLIFGYVFHEGLPYSRQVQLFGYGEFESFQSLDLRFELLRTGIIGILSSPIKGIYGGVSIIHTGSYTYIHNLLSVWEHFGLMPFMLYVILILYTLRYCILLLKSGQYVIDKNAQLIISIASIMIIEVVFAKSYAWPHIALLWGLVAGHAQYSCRYEQLNGDCDTKHKERTLNN